MMSGCGANCQLKALVEIVAPFTSRSCCQGDAPSVQRGASTLATSRPLDQPQGEDDTTPQLRSLLWRG